MKHFEYKARDANAKLVTGKLEAESQDSVSTYLLNKGLTPVQITQAKGKRFEGNLLKMELTPKKVKPDDFVMWCRQMTALLRAGVPILVCLKQTAEHTEKSLLKKALKDVAHGITTGQTLAGSLKAHPKIFKPVFISIVDAGEQSGQLETAFDQLAAYFDLESKTRRRIKTATRYPMLVISTILIALAVINFMVIPTFAELYSRYDANLPAVTQILISMSNFCLAYWPWMVGIVGIVGYALYRYGKTTQGRLLFDKIILKLPIVGPLVFQINIARFARAFTMTLRAGVPLVNAISLVSNTIGNSFIQSKMMHLKEGAEKGEPLSKCAQDVKLLSPLATQMLKTGEDSGNIDTMLEQVALFYEEDIDYKLGNLSQSIEPILLVIMGIMVLILALGVFLPLWDMTSFAGH